ncbi:MAG: hypothetical protein C4297_07470 [Gemmataceae bacterium]
MRSSCRCLRFWLASVGACFVLVCLAAGERQAASRFRYRETSWGKGALSYTGSIPVLRVEGTPEEIGAQVAHVAARHAPRLLHYPRDLLHALKLEPLWPTLVAAGKGLLERFPAEHRRELEAMAQAGLDRDLLVVGNTMFDIKKLFGCSALVVEPSRSRTGTLLFGRNLDFPTLGYLHQYTLVTVYKPRGKRAFASVGFPGLIGCLSGINDAGLALAINEVYQAADGSPAFDPQGTPYALIYRRLLEECASVEEALRSLAAFRHATMTHLTLCDARSAVIVELTPRSLVVRRSEDGLHMCTNHFLSGALAVSGVRPPYRSAERLEALRYACRFDRLGLNDIAAVLHRAHHGPFTLQTMVFEPARLRLYLAFGECPASALPLECLDLAPWLTSRSQ